MCTVTYLPLSEGSILTSNRDESLLREPALAPKLYSVFGKTVFYPKDLKAHGTWIATSGEFTICLLNGAFEKHIPSNIPYRKSRGLMVLDFFRFNGIKSFVSGYDFEGIEPFTLIVVESRTETFLYELRWDGHKLHFKKLDVLEPKIWSSATLYTWETISQRQTWFKKWLGQHSKFTEEAILNFHHFAGSDDPANSLVMKREDQKQTVSITSVQINKSGSKMAYEDLLLNQVTHCTIPAEMAENIC